MSLKQFLSILAARWVTAAVIAAVTVAVAIGVSLQLPKAYTASASLMIDISSPDQVGGFVLSQMAMPSYMSTQVDLMMSERVARRAISLLNLQNDDATRAAWMAATKGQGDYESWLAESLQKALVIKPSRDSNIITVLYEAHDPDVAAARANAFIQGYIDTSLELRVDPARQNNNFFDARARQMRDTLEAAQSKLSSFQRENGLIGGGVGQLDIENSRLQELSTQYVMMQALAAETSGRQSQAGTRPEQLPEVLGNSVVSGLSADLAREETRMREMLTRLGDNHPQVQEQRTRIAELKSRIDAATARASGSVGVTNNVTQARLAQVRAALEAQRARVLQLKTVRDQAEVLARDVESAQRAYEAVLQRVNQTSLESKTNQTNITVVKRATAPAFPSSPKLKLNAALALVVGTLLGFGALMLREMLDRRLRTDTDVLIELKQPLLVTLPVARISSATDTNRERLMKARVLTGLPRPAAKA